MKYSINFFPSFVQKSRKKMEKVKKLTKFKKIDIIPEGGNPKRGRKSMFWFFAWFGYIVPFFCRGWIRSFIFFCKAKKKPGKNCLCKICYCKTKRIACLLFFCKNHKFDTCFYAISANCIVSIMIWESRNTKTSTSLKNKLIHSLRNT